jgi:two-component system sensor histidine kinase HydH
MTSQRSGFRLPLPLLTILASVITLLVLLAISTYRNLERERRQLEESLLQQGAILIRGLEAGARTGMMRMAWEEEILQVLVDEVTREANVAGVEILEADGRTVAESHSPSLGRKIPVPENLVGLLEASEVRGWRNGDMYVVGKRFVPLRRGPAMGYGPGALPGAGLGMGRGWGRPAPAPPPPRVALVAMFLGPHLESERRDLWRALLMGVALLVLGTASFYFIFVVQNLHLVRRTLRGMATYTAHLVEGMPNGLISVNPRGEILTINSKGRELLGLQEPPIGRGIELLGAAWQRILGRVNQGQRLLDEEVENRTPSGVIIPLAVSATRVRGGDGEDLGAVILLRDLREVRALQEQVRRSERLASLGRLAAGVAHEIRNPLSSIRGFAQLFQRRFTDGSEDRRYAEVMVQEVDRLNRVISNLLDFARPKEPALKQTSPREMVDHALALLRNEAEARGIQIRVEGDAGLQQLDPDQMTQAMLNVLLNAVEAMERGGQLQVTLRRSEEARGWSLEIRDTGPGIPQEDLPRLFDPFFTTKKEGTGLGLAIVHRIVENHGGLIDVQSELGKGTRFTLRFGQAQGAA